MVAWMKRATWALLVAAGLGAVLCAVPTTIPRAFAADVELIMFDDATCPWCRRWRREVGPAYPNTPEGKRAPLRSIDISKARTSGVALSAPVRMTPTFVLVEGGREVGRITGYPGPDFFWTLLDDLLKKLGPDTQKPKRDGDRASLTTVVQ